MIHQLGAEFEGAAADIEVQAREVVRLNARLIEMLAADTGQAAERIAHDLNRAVGNSSTGIVWRSVDSEFATYR
jgi:ATP-dependent protease ClpP protease subunit